MIEKDTPNAADARCEYALQTDRLTKRYGEQYALNGLDMRVPRGGVYGFVGRNGAGKTTLIRLICGLQRPTSGGYALFGAPHDGGEIAKARRRIGAVVETPAIYLDMSAAENLKQQYLMLGRRSFDGIGKLLGQVGLGDAGRKRARHFSLGMKQRLGIAMALAGNPDLLVLDEPANGLDPEGVVAMRELLRRLNREQEITLLISSHNLDELSRLATHYGIIDRGRMVRELSAAELDAACRKCVRMAVSDAAALGLVLETMGKAHSIVSATEVDVYDPVNVTQLALSLAAEHCEILSMQDRSETLEGYFMSLVGGDGRD